MIFSEQELDALSDRLRHLTSEQLKNVDLGKLYVALTGRLPNLLWNPLPGPQTMAYDSPADELFFGGAAGPGKTDLMLGLALTRHKRTLFLRRESTDLEAAATRLRAIAGMQGSWRSIGPYGGMMLTKDGRHIEMSGCKDEADKISYQGRDHDLKAFDEVAHFTRSQYEFIITWNRTSEHNQRCRVVAAGNPPTNPEGRWVIECWAPWLDQTHPDPAEPGELRWYTSIDNKIKWLKDSTPFTHKGELITPRSRTFIPGRLEHNPIMEERGYRAVIQRLPEPLRTQMLYGDMNAGQDDDDYQVIPTAWVRAAMDRWEEGPPEGFTLSCLGVDVARGGADKTVITPRYLNWFGRQTKYDGKATPDGQAVAAKVAMFYKDDAYINIDIIGIGSSAYDVLKETYGKRVVGVNNSNATEYTDKRSKQLRFRNVRAASYWAMREALDPENDEKIALPPDPELLSDLCAARYVMQSSGIKIEEKVDIKERIGRSPDCADSCVLANWMARKKEFWIA